ncbi:UDP-glucose 6-dehydrogenase, partial [Burkholderia multivorans]
MKIAVAGTGYVGLSNAVILAQNHDVVAVDLAAGKVDLINRGISPIVDPEITDYLATQELSLSASTDGDSAYASADIVVIATPTNYDEKTDSFDTSTVESVLDQVLAVNSGALLVVKSTVPVG